MPLHILAEPDQIARVALLPGDPARAERIAARLEGVSCYNRNRGLLGFTGRWRGVPVSVQTTGMGAPAAAIVAEELIELGARVLVRVGTCGGARPEVRPGDLIVATAAVPLDGTTAAYVRGAPYAPVASFAVTRALADAAHLAGAAYHTGLIATDDAFYHPDPDHYAARAARGVLAFEMEAAALMTVAALRRVHAGCLLAVSNTVGAADWLTDVSRDQAIDRLIDVVLSALPALVSINPDTTTGATAGS
jgi:purine-nucleoside phosphorylase